MLVAVLVSSRNTNRAGSMRPCQRRRLAAKAKGLGRKVLIVPHLMSFGGIEQGIRKRLEGLDYTMTTQALMPDERIASYVSRAQEL